MEKKNWLLGFALGAIVLSILGGALVVDTFTQEPDYTALRSQVQITIKLANKKKSTKMVGPRAPGWVPLSQISNHIMGAVISSEDTSFYSHQGVDFHELKEALKKDLQEKRWARGASTLTQQVVKNAFLSQEKTLWRKFKEFFWAQKLEKHLSKSEILGFYLNMAEWGPGIYGIGQATQHYFGVSPASVTAKQAAFLAMLLPSPVKYHSYFGNKELTPWAQSRVEKILKVMMKMGFIDEATYQVALGEKLWEVSDPAGTVSDWAEGEPVENATPPAPLKSIPPSSGQPHVNPESISPVEQVPGPDVPESPSAVQEEVEENP